MKEIAIANFGTRAEILMMEPALEALQYQEPDARITIYGSEPVDHVQPLFAEHPLELKYLRTPSDHTEAKLLEMKMKDLTSYGRTPPRGPHLVHQYAAKLGVNLLRDTPSLGNYRHSRWTLYDRWLVTDGTSFISLTHADYQGFHGAALTSHPTLEEKINCIKRAEIYIGSDPLYLQIAHAVGVRKIIAIYNEEVEPLLTAYPSMQIIHADDGHRVDKIRHALNAALKEEKYPAFLNRGNACDFIKNTALQYCHGYGLDVGSNLDEWALPGAIPSDEKSRKFDQGPFDYIFSSHCLEHIREWKEELQIWDAALRPGGVMFLYVPHPAMTAWHPEGDWVKGGWHVWSPEPVELVLHLNQSTNLKVERYTTYPDPCWGFYIVARKK